MGPVTGLLRIFRCLGGSEELTSREPPSCVHSRAREGCAGGGNHGPFGLMKILYTGGRLAAFR